MKTYIIEIHPFPHIVGRDKLIRVNSEEELDIVLIKLEEKLKLENPMFEYDLAGNELESYIDNIELVDVD